MSVIKNEIYTIDIESLTHDGNGVGKINGFVVFVPMSAIGDRLKIKILKVKQSYAYGNIIEIISPSADRIEPVCGIYKRCGACQLQHISYDAELLFKQNHVKNCISKIGKIDIEILPILKSQEIYHYRNKEQYPVDQNGKIGFYAARSHNVVEVTDCIASSMLNNKILSAISEYMKEFSVDGYNEETGKGIIRHICIRNSDNEFMVIIVTNGSNLPYKNQLIEKLVNVSDKIRSIIQNINSKRNNVILGDKNKLLWGQKHITSEISGIFFNISPLSFYQVNSGQIETLYNEVLNLAGLTGTETVFDLYSGIGTISLFLSKKAKKIIGVEIVSEAVKDARENASLNNIENAEFFEGAAEEIVPVLYKQGLTADVVILDPPRKGCDEKLLKCVSEMGVQRIVYVSCNPATLARDMAYLNGLGYKAEKVRPVDMFPRTKHVECVILMSRKEG